MKLLHIYPFLFLIFCILSCATAQTTQKFAQISLEMSESILSFTLNKNSISSLLLASIEDLCQSDVAYSSTGSHDGHIYTATVYEKTSDLHNDCNISAINNYIIAEQEAGIMKQMEKGDNPALPDPPIWSGQMVEIIALSIEDIDLPKVCINNETGELYCVDDNQQCTSILCDLGNNCSSNDVCASGWCLEWSENNDDFKTCVAGSYYINVYSIFSILSLFIAILYV